MPFRTWALHPPWLPDAGLLSMPVTRGGPFARYHAAQVAFREGYYQVTGSRDDIDTSPAPAMEIVDPRYLYTRCARSKGS